MRRHRHWRGSPGLGQHHAAHLVRHRRRRTEPHRRAGHRRLHQQVVSGRWPPRERASGGSSLLIVGELAARRRLRLALRRGRPISATPPDRHRPRSARPRCRCWSRRASWSRATIYFGLDTSFTVGSARGAARHAADGAAPSDSAPTRSILCGAGRCRALRRRWHRAVPAAWPNLREAVTLATAALLFACVVVAAAAACSPARGPQVRVLEPLPGLADRLRGRAARHAVRAGRLALWILNSIYSIGYMRGNGEAHQTRFYVCFALALGGGDRHRLRRQPAHAVPLLRDADADHLSAGDASRHRRGAARRAASTSAILHRHVGAVPAAGHRLHVGGSPARWPSVPAASCRRAWARSPLAVLLALFMFGIGKAALMPFHRWLPAAMVAPTPVSALLHAVAVVKAGVFTVVKVVVYVFGLDVLAGATRLARCRSPASPSSPPRWSRCRPTT